MGQLRFEVSSQSNDLDQVQAVFQKLCRTFVLKRYRISSVEQKGDFIEYSYELRLQDEMQGMELLKSLRQIEHVENVRLNFNDTYVNQYD